MKKILMALAVLVLLSGCAKSEISKSREELNPTVSTSEAPTEAEKVTYAALYTDVTWCERCDKEVPYDFIGQFNGQNLCASCLEEVLEQTIEFSLDPQYQKCKSCGNFFDAWQSFDHCARYGYCEDCVGNYVTSCSLCDEYAEIIEKCDFALCDYCFADVFYFQETKDLAELARLWCDDDVDYGATAKGIGDMIASALSTAE